MQLKHEPCPEQIKQEKIYKEMNVTDEEFELIQKHLGRLPNYPELGLFSVMWSEHCSYKSSKPVLKKFPTSGPQVLQGPGEGAGIVNRAARMPARGQRHKIHSRERGDKRDCNT